MILTDRAVIALQSLFREQAGSPKINSLLRLSLTAFSPFDIHAFTQVECMQSLAKSKKLQNLIALWPISVVALGAVLTLLWIAVIAWLPLRLLFSIAWLPLRLLFSA